MFSCEFYEISKKIFLYRTPRDDCFSLMRFEQRKRIVKLFTMHFSYCLLVWMFHSRHLNNGINHIHERAWRIIYQDYNFSFAELLRKDSISTIHQRNFKLLVTEVFKVKIGVAPDIIRAVYYGTHKASFINPKIRNILYLIAAKMQPH